MFCNCSEGQRSLHYPKESKHGLAKQCFNLHETGNQMQAFPALFIVIIEPREIYAVGWFYGNWLIHQASREGELESRNLKSTTTKMPCYCIHIHISQR